MRWTYMILYAGGMDTLASMVSEKMRDGWKPHGNLIVERLEWENERKGYTESSTSYYQPVIRELDTEE